MHIIFLICIPKLASENKSPHKSQEFHKNVTENYTFPFFGVIFKWILLIFKAKNAWFHDKKDLVRV